MHHLPTRDSFNTLSTTIESWQGVSTFHPQQIVLFLIHGFAETAWVLGMQMPRPMSPVWFSTGFLNSWCPRPAPADDVVIFVCGPQGFNESLCRPILEKLGYKHVATRRRLQRGPNLTGWNHPATGVGDDHTNEQGEVVAIFLAAL